MEFRQSDSVVFHVRIRDMIRAYRSGNCNSEWSCPIAQAIMRTLGLQQGEVKVSREKITLVSSSSPSEVVIDLQSSPLLGSWIRNWDNSFLKLRRTFHFEVIGRQQGKRWKVKRVWR